MTPEAFTAWLHEKPIRVLDGATGSELVRLAVPSAARLWGAGALIEAPGAVKELHQRHAASGAEALTACTFRVSPYALRRAGLENRAAELARRAVELARAGAAAAGRHCLVLGSQTMLEDCYRPDLAPGDSTLEREHRATSHMLADAGADAILLETCNSVRESAVAARAAAETGLAVIVSFVCKLRGLLLSTEDAAEAAAAVSLPGVVAVGVNCTAVNDMPAALDRLAPGTRLPLAAYANNAWFAEDSAFLRADPLGPPEYAHAARGWLTRGVRLLGGCCGTTPAHVAALVALVEDLGSTGDGRSLEGNDSDE